MFFSASLTILFAVLLAFATHLTAATSHQHLHDQKPITAEMPSPLSVLRTPLALHSTSPMTGFLRNGYCAVPPSDTGNHSVAAEVSEEFLTFSASKGNDLRTVGLTGGCKWCLCATRWKEALDAYKSGEVSEKAVPKVWLAATEESALKKVNMDDLKKFAVDK